MQKLIAKQNCDIDSFEVKELVGEYGFVMKQLAQNKRRKRLYDGTGAVLPQ